MMGLIRRSYTHLDKRFFRFLFSSLIGPHLEHCVSIWYSLLKEYEELIENVFASSTRLILGLYDKPYECLSATEVCNMRYCRIQGDILVYKIIYDDNHFLCDLFMINESQDKRL